MEVLVGSDPAIWDGLYMSSVIILLSAMVTTALGLGFSFAQSFSYRYDIIIIML